MIEGQELLRNWWCRIWRRRWLCLGVTSASCALGWTGVGLLAAPQTAAGAGLLLGVVLLAAAAVGCLTAAAVAGRAPVFDSVAQLQEMFRQPVLGSVADLTPGAGRRAISGMRFALACLGLITLFAGLLLVGALGLSGP